MMKTRISVVLAHHPCLDKMGGMLTTSITNLDVHDIARSARTYQCAAFYIVTPVHAQQQMARDIIGFWEGTGFKRNQDRHEALQRARVVASIEDAIAAEQQELGMRPWVLCTSAKPQGVMTWSQARAHMPTVEGAMIVFGTGHGLHADALALADNTTTPIQGHVDYNHLSVRSAAAIALDRLLGVAE
jgi:tRNA (guanine37-N1)-methyltransferase